MAKVIRNNERIIKVVNDYGPVGWLLFTAYIGAFVYFFSIDLTFWGFIVALLKALVWPAFVIFEALKALGIS